MCHKGARATKRFQLTTRMIHFTSVSNDFLSIFHSHKKLPCYSYKENKNGNIVFYQKQWSWLECFKERLASRIGLVIFFSSQTAQKSVSVVKCWRLYKTTTQRIDRFFLLPTNDCFRKYQHGHNAHTYVIFIHILSYIFYGICVHTNMAWVIFNEYNCNKIWAPPFR